METPVLPDELNSKTDYQCPVQGLQSPAHEDPTLKTVWAKLGAVTSSL